MRAVKPVRAARPMRAVRFLGNARVPEWRGAVKMRQEFLQLAERYFNAPHKREHAGCGRSMRPKRPRAHNTARGTLL